MEKKGYETLLAREAFYETKLQRAQKRSINIIKRADQEAVKLIEDSLAEGKNTLHKEQGKLANQHQETLQLLAQQTENYHKAIKRKETQLPELARKIAQDLLKEWDAA